MIQLARLSGFAPIITTASLHNAPFLKSLGATHVLDRSLPDADILRSLPKLTDGKPLEYVCDAISNRETQRLAYDALAHGGGLVCVQPAVRSAAWIADKVKEGDGKKVVRPFGSYVLPGNQELGREVYNRLEEWVASGQIVVRVAFVPRVSGVGWRGGGG